MLRYNYFQPEENEPKQAPIKFQYSRLPWEAAAQYNMETRSNGKKLTVTGPRKDSLLIIS